MTHREKLAFIEGAKEMLKWIDTAMDSGDSASRKYMIKTYQIRQMVEYLDIGKSQIYNS